MANQEHNDNLQEVREDLNNLEDEEESDEEGDFEWHEQDWFEDDGSDLESILDTPAERSGHIAVVDRNCMYIWGGYKVSGKKIDMPLAYNVSDCFWR